MTTGMYATLDQIFDRVQREITEDIAAGTVPADVASFGELHDHVDANEYGGLCDDNADLSLELTIAMQARVDRWLRSRLDPNA